MTSGNKKSSQIKRYLGYFIPVLLAVFFLYLAFKGVDLGAAFDIIAGSSLTWMLIFIISFYLSHLIRAFRWKVMLHSIKPNTSVLNLLGATMIGYGVNFIVPRLGELYRALFAGKWENISRSSMLGSIVVERVIDILALGISVLLSVFIYSGNLYVELQWLKSALVFGFIGLFATIFLLFLLVKFKEKFYNVIVNLVGRISTTAAEKLSYILKMLVDGFATIKGSRNYFWTIFLTVLIMLIYGLTSYLGFYVLGMEEIKDVNFEMAWVVMTISAFGVIIPTPGGTGSYHFIVKSVIVGLYGFSQEVGSAYALMTHFVSSVIFILSTFFFIAFINKRREKLGFAKENFVTVLKGERNQG